ncbi:MAG TPA: hypothetical protein VFX92_14405 [Candidatus Krumholzibacteria bacterium]|nr:hypothetical protein [Candidatus Krumholzibacteria bacterium]
MRPHTRSALVVFAVLAVGLAACSKDKSKPANYAIQGEFVSEQDSFPRLRYLDTGLVSINDRCAVRKVRLNPKMPPVYVNGQPVGFC